MVEAWFMLAITVNRVTVFTPPHYPTEAACLAAIPDQKVMVGNRNLVETGDIGVVCVKGRISKIVAGDYKP